jgi:hypothetical protein
MRQQGHRSGKSAASTGATDSKAIRVNVSLSGEQGQSVVTVM